MFITDNTAILNQYNSLMHEKSHFKTSAAIFLTLKDKQYIFKVNVADSINFITVDSIEKSIEKSVNVPLSDDSTMMI